MTTIHSEGAHSEWCWAREFSDAYEWLFADINLTISETESFQQALFYPNPSDDIIFINGYELIRSLSIIDIAGKSVFTSSEPSDSLNISSLASGKYLINYITITGEMNSLKWNKL